MGTPAPNKAALVVPTVNEPKGYFLVGPTATGKTAVAHVIARKFKACILSADSMQVYRGLEIGTAKPERRDREEIPYFGIDIVDPTETFSVGTFLQEAQRAIAFCVAEKRPLLVVGGTGLYVKCLVAGLAAVPSAHPELRKKAERLIAEKGCEAAYRELQRCDPARAETVKDWKNPRRLVRALELAWLNAPVTQTWKRGITAVVAGLMVERSLLHRRIEERVRKMFADGLVQEVASLYERYGKLSQTARHAVGYEEAALVWQNKMTLEDAVRQTVQRTRQLAKRQMTWFRHQLTVDWVEVCPDESVEATAEKVLDVWQKNGPTPLHI